MPSHFANYIYEREGKSIFEDERGFVTYMFWPEQQAVYMEDIYVRPEHRKSGVTYEFVQQVSNVAKLKGYKYLIGTVKPTANGATTSLKGMLAHGFEVDSCDGTLIWFRRNV